LVVTRVDRTAGRRRRYHQLNLDWISVCTKLRPTGMPIKTIRRYAQLVSAARGNEQERLALLEAHRAEVTAKLAELQENLKLIDHKLDVYRCRLARWRRRPTMGAQPPGGRPLNNRLTEQPSVGLAYSSSACRRLPITAPREMARYE
jgi:DNA-binding transcriptional MerR regulator